MSGTGSAALKRYQAGKRLTRGEAIEAKCAECCADYADGRLDCGITRCPLYQWMPYHGRQESPQGED